MLAGRRVLLGVTGGIAAYKAAILTRLLTGAGAEVTAVLTESATRFIGADTFSGLTGRAALTSLWQRPGEVLHIRLAHEADVVVIAPCTANVLAKLAHGIADDLLTSTLLEYRGTVVIAPAMHSGMWEAAATHANVAALRERGVRFVGTGDRGPRARRRGHRPDERTRRDPPGGRRCARPARPRGDARADHRRTHARADRPRPLPREPFERPDGRGDRGGGPRSRRRRHADPRTGDGRPLPRASRSWTSRPPSSSGMR